MAAHAEQEDAELSCTLDAIAAALLDAVPRSAWRARRYMMHTAHWEEMCARASRGTLSAADLYDEAPLWSAFTTRVPYPLDCVRRPNGCLDLIVTINIGY